MMESQIIEMMIELLREREDYNPDHDPYQSPFI